MNRPQSHDEALNAVLGEAVWLRRLAVALVGEARAEDLAQETVVTALREGPGLRGAPLRGWLRTVMRRLSMGGDRRDRQRRWAEEGAARRESSGGEVEDRAEARLRLHRVLNSAIEELPPNYRTVLVLTYLEDLPPRDVARRLGISPEAARQRLSRGLKMLRGKLDREYGPERQWMAALVGVMTMKKIAAVAGVVLVVWLGWELRPGSQAAAGGEGAAGWVEQEVVALDPEKGLADRKILGGEETAAREVPPGYTQKEPPPASPEPRVFRGRIVMRDLHGARMADRDGRVNVRLVKVLPGPVGSGTVRTSNGGIVPVKAGVFSIEVRPDTEIVEVEAVDWGGDAALCEFEKEVASLDFDKTHDVPGRLAPKWHVSVLDDATGVHLTHVDLMAGGERQAYPGPNRIGHRLATMEGSPMVVDWGIHYVARESCLVWVGAPGYAWQQIRVSTGEVEPKEVRLKPGGQLTVELSAPAPEGSRIRIRERGSERHMVFDYHPGGQAGPFVLEGVPLGWMVASLELGRHYRADRISNAAEVEIQSQSPGQVRLEVDVPAARPEVPVRLKLELPKGYGLAKPELFVRFKGNIAKRRTPGGCFEGLRGKQPEQYDYNFGRLPIGEYSVVLLALSFREEVTIRQPSTGGVVELHMKVPDPVVLSVKVLDAFSRRPVESEVVYWDGLTAGSELGANLFQPLNFDGDLGVYRGLVPEGMVFLMLGGAGEGYQTTLRRVQAKRGMGVLRYELDREYTLKVRFQESGNRAILPEDYKVEIEGPDGESVRTASRGKGSIGLAFARPGRFRIQFPDLPGFAPIEPLTVEVEEWPIQELMVELKKP